MTRRSLLAFAVFLVTATCASSVSAQENGQPTDETDETGEMSSYGLATGWQDDPLWRPEFRDFRWWEYAATAGGLGLAFGMRFLGPTPPPTFTGPALFDTPVMNAWVSQNNGVRESWSNISDKIWISSMVFRGFDSVVTPGLIHGQWKTSGRMLMMDLEAFSLMSGAIWSTQAFVGRTRPASEGCGDPDVRSAFCGSEKNRSFISGHVATSTTATALTCTHHLNMPLLGNKWAGVAVCGVAATLNTINGVGRIVVEAHYPTDVVMGMALGVAAGWLLPQTLHYGWGNSNADDLAETDRPHVRWSVGPSAGADRGGLGVRASF